MVFSAPSTGAHCLDRCAQIACALCCNRHAPGTFHHHDIRRIPDIDLAQPRSDAGLPRYVANGLGIVLDRGFSDIAHRAAAGASDCGVPCRRSERSKVKVLQTVVSIAFLP